MSRINGITEKISHRSYFKLCSSIEEATLGLLLLWKMAIKLRLMTDAPSDSSSSPYKHAKGCSSVFMLASLLFGCLFIKSCSCGAKFRVVI